jgi:hypothetical protein
LTESGEGASGAEGAAADETSADFEVPELRTTVEWFSRPDPVLLDMVGLANIGPGLPVTLYLSWGIASGHVASADRFFAAAAASVRAAEVGQDANEDLAEAIAKRSFDPWAEHVPEDQRMRTNLQQGYDLTTFMHLSDVHTFLSTWSTWQAHEFMRIRVSDVTGWAYGTMRGSAG